MGKAFEAKYFREVIGTHYQRCFSASYRPKSVVHVCTKLLFGVKVFVLLAEKLIQLVLESVAYLAVLGLSGW